MRTQAGTLALLALLTVLALLALSSGDRVQASAPVSGVRTFSFAPGTNGDFTIPPLAGYHHSQLINLEVEGGDGGDGANGSTGGDGSNVFATTDLMPVSKLHVIVGTNGSPGDLSEMSPAPGGQPGGGSGAPGGGGGGGYSAAIAVIPAHSFRIIAGGGGGGGDRPLHAHGGRSSGDGGDGEGIATEEAVSGAPEGTAGPGQGARGLDPGTGGTAGSGDGAQPGANGGVDGAGGIGVSGGGGGGGGGGYSTGGGGGGGGSCGAGQPNCIDGHAGGGGGAGGTNDGPVTEVLAEKTPKVVVTVVYFNDPPTGLASTVFGAVQSGQGGEGPAVSLGCSGPVSTTCGLSASVTTGGAGRSEDASSARARGRGKSVLLAQASITLVAGQRQRVVLGLDNTGLALLHHRHRLAARLTVTQRGLTGKLRTIASRAFILTLRGRGHR